MEWVSPTGGPSLFGRPTRKRSSARDSDTFSAQFPNSPYMPRRFPWFLGHLRIFAASSVAPVEQESRDSCDDEDGREELVGALGSPSGLEQEAGKNGGKDGYPATKTDHQADTRASDHCRI